jgi:hypothetical protein
MPDDTTTKPKARMSPNVHVGGGGLDTAALRQLAESEPKAFMAKTQGLIDEGKLRWSNIGDLRHLFFALSDVQVPATVSIMGQQRAIMASAFPLLSGALTVAGINEAYESVPTIGQDLVTDREDPKRITTMASIQSLDTEIDTVKEGDDFPEIGAGEEKFEIRSKRNGRRFSITAEAIEENDVADIVTKVNALGQIAADWVEEQTLRRVCDIDGSAASAAEPYVLRPNGSGTALYSATADTPGTRAPSGTRVNTNALVDTTDLDAARAVLAAMKNSRGKRISIPISRCTLLVPDALAGTALKIQGSELEPGIENELNNWGTRGAYRPQFRSSPKLDDLSTTAWYLGWFQRQFIRKWKLRFEYVTLSGDTESFLRRRPAFQGRIAWDCEIGATDYVYVVQSIEATTAP